MSETTERDARLRLYAELGDSRQYLGPQEDGHAASTLLRADVASLLKERDALQADYAAAVRALEVLRVKCIGIAGPNDIVLMQFDPKLRREWWQKAAIDCVKWCEAAISSPRAVQVLKEREVE